MQKIVLTNIPPQKTALTNVPPQKIGIGNARNVIVGSGEPYDGEYVFIPSGLQQIVETKNKTLQENIIIEPIPSNYGLITYNGFELTVS